MLSGKLRGLFKGVIGVIHIHIYIYRIQDLDLLSVYALLAGFRV